MEIAILITLIIGFIITWIVCCKPATEDELISKPDGLKISSIGLTLQNYKNINGCMRSYRHDTLYGIRTTQGR